jgi:hypothetical protein
MAGAWAWGWAWAGAWGWAALWPKIAFLIAPKMLILTLLVSGLADLLMGRRKRE